MSTDRQYLTLAQRRYGLKGIEDVMSQIPADRMEHFIYGSEEAGIVLAAAAGSTATLTIDISQEADFIATKIAGTHILGTSTNTYSVEMIASDTDRQLQNRAIPQDNFFGTAQLPSIFSKPRIFWRNTRVKFILTRQVAGTGTDRVWIAMHGYKVFYDLSNLNLTSRVS